MINSNLAEEIKLKVKVIRPKSPIMILGVSVIFAILIIFISGTIIGFVEYGISWLPFLVLFTSIFAILYFVRLSISMLSRKIILDDESIIVKKDKFSKKLIVMQYNVKVNYNDISNIYLTISPNDSHNQEVFGFFTPMPYIVLESKDGASHAIYCYYYSKRQVVDIFNEIVKKAQSKGNLIECLSGEKFYDEFKEKIVRH